ncbi:MAG: homogentisate 1,2-dioxygenase [Alphaproteobacteria bacterium]|nr:homogentisate 1,2-dioxygenase [Alphaproteobacteria bacterium]
MAGRDWITFSRVEGEASRQAHADLPDGTFEREIGQEGFFGPAAHLHHRHPPTAWSEFTGPLRPHAFDLGALRAGGDLPWRAPVLLRNASVAISFWGIEREMTSLARNADGDQLFFVHEGEGALFCDWGHLSYRPGDYIVMPRGAMWRLSPSVPSRLLLIEATGSHFRLPDKGILGRHAIFDPAMLDVPAINAAFKAQQDERPWQVAIKRGGAVSTVTYPFNPLDAIGWHGDLSPVRINVRDIRPIMSHRYHVPPSAHSTFIADRFVVCSFVPRPFESDPGALKVPFFHNNDDFDEVLFYHAGDFFSRDNIKAGMITYHPCGFTHGPHPKALENAFKPRKDATDEYAVMIDTRDALEVGEGGRACEVDDYVNSWKAR